MAASRIVEAAKRGGGSGHNRAPVGRRWTPLSRGKLALLGLPAVAAVIFCAHRILAFVPQPVDSHETLRPVLYAFFRSFIRRYASPARAQDAWGTYCIVALLIPACLAFWNYLHTRIGSQAPVRLQKVICSRPLLFIGIALCLVVCRFPALLAGEISPDETFFIAAADKLFRDPIFFRAVDFVTSGPLNVYPLMLPAIFGISPDYVSTRLIALAFIFASIYIVYRTLALLTDDATARIAVLPAAGAFAVLKYDDFLHCSSEHVSFLLLSVALYMCVRTFRRPESHAWHVVGLGVVTSAAFLAKMQAVPIIGCIAAIAVVYIHGAGRAERWWRPGMLFTAGLAPLLILNAVVCAWAGVWHDFWMEYIVGNYNYPEAHGTLTVEVQRFVDFGLGITEVRMLGASLLGILAAYFYQKRWLASEGQLERFVRTGVVGGIVAVAGSLVLRNAGGAAIGYALMISMFILPGSLLLLYRTSDWGSGQVRWFGFLAAAVLAVAAVVTYLPHRIYGHYLLLLVFPVSVAMAWTVVAASEDSEALVGGNEVDLSRHRFSRLPFVLVFAALTLACELFELGSPDFIAFAAMPATVRAQEGELIDALTQPGGRITVWGWNGRPYLAAGRVSALKDLFIGQLFLTSGEVQAYYRTGYLSGLQHHPPELFVDAIETSLGGFGNRKVYDFEQIPEINSYIQTHYVPVLRAYKQRLYIRRELARSVAGIGDARKCDVQAIRCFEASAAAWIPADLPPIQMPEHALIEAIFTPETKQDRLATVFSNEGSPRHEGFEFLHMENDRYRLGVGWGSDGALSEEMLLPQRKPVNLAIEVDGNAITIVCNGVKRAEMRLPKRMLDSPNPVTVGSWIEHQRPFLGNIQFFQIRDLGRGR